MFQDDAKEKGIFQIKLRKLIVFTEFLSQRSKSVSVQVGFVLLLLLQKYYPKHFSGNIAGRPSGNHNRHIFNRNKKAP